MLEWLVSRQADRRWLAWLALSAVVVMLDQLSKQLMQAVLLPGQSIRVTPFFDLVLVFLGSFRATPQAGAAPDFGLS